MKKSVETYKPPIIKIHDKATFFERFIFKFHRIGIGNTIRRASVVMFGMATPRKYLTVLIHVLGLNLSQNPSTGEQENTPTKTCVEDIIIRSKKKKNVRILVDFLQ